jgi:hypothetical protein
MDASCSELTAKLYHGFLELLSVFGDVDAFDGGAKNLYVIFLDYALLMQ